jgi:hypothetical protein
LVFSQPVYGAQTLGNTLPSRLGQAQCGG